MSVERGHAGLQRGGRHRGGRGGGATARPRSRARIGARGRQRRLARSTPAPLLDDAAAKDPRVRVIHQKNARARRRRDGGARRGRAANTCSCSTATGRFRWTTSQRRGARSRQGVTRCSACAAGVTTPRCGCISPRLIRAVVRLLFGVQLHDANVPYKLLRKSIWDEARPLVPDGTLAPSMFLAIIAKRARLRHRRDRGDAQRARYW